MTNKTKSAVSDKFGAKLNKISCFYKFGENQTKSAVFDKFGAKQNKVSSG